VLLPVLQLAYSNISLRPHFKSSPLSRRNRQVTSPRKQTFQPRRHHHFYTYIDWTKKLLSSSSKPSHAPSHSPEYQKCLTPTHANVSPSTPTVPSHTTWLQPSKHQHPLPSAHKTLNQPQLLHHHLLTLARMPPTAANPAPPRSGGREDKQSNPLEHEPLPFSFLWRVLRIGDI
jgi:hypothetical protein